MEGTYTKRYHNCYALILQLSKSERLFLDFITEKMDEENIIANNKATHDSFNALLLYFKQTPYKSSTIHKCFSRLSKLELIKNIKGKRGLYMVNPIFFHNKEDVNGVTERAKLIRNELEKSHKEAINNSRHKKLSNKDSL